MYTILIQKLQKRQKNLNKTETKKLPKDQKNQNGQKK